MALRFHSWVAFDLSDSLQAIVQSAQYKLSVLAKHARLWLYFRSILAGEFNINQTLLLPLADGKREN